MVYYQSKSVEYTRKSIHWQCLRSADSVSDLGSIATPSTGSGSFLRSDTFDNDIKILKSEDLQIQFNGILVRSENNDSLSLSIQDLAIEDSFVPGMTRLKDKAGKAVTALVGQTSFSTLIINWNPKLDSDLRILPELPSEVKVLHIRDCPNIFYNPTSYSRDGRFTPWFIHFTENLAGLNRLVLSTSGYTERNLRDLRASIPRLELSIDDETVEWRSRAGQGKKYCYLLRRAQSFTWTAVLTSSYCI